MLLQPEDLSDDRVAARLRHGWGLGVDSIAYAPLGFGSHHWHVSADNRRYFATVDDLEMGERSALVLEAALHTARSLSEAGHRFIIGPLPSKNDAVTVGLDGDARHVRFLLSLYPHVDGTSFSHGHYETTADRIRVVERLAELHAATAPPATPADPMKIPSRSQLVAELDGTADRWESGPFGDQAQDALAEHAEAIHNALALYDQLAIASQTQSERFVVTHGEPHRANTMRTADGVVLIDWETCRLAPPERDLWALIDEDPAVASRYEELTGTSPEPDALELYRLWWDLCEVALYTCDLREAHDDTPETQIAWAGLRDHSAKLARRHAR